MRRRGGTLLRSTVGPGRRGPCGRVAVWQRASDSGLWGFLPRHPEAQPARPGPGARRAAAAGSIRGGGGGLGVSATVNRGLM